MLIASFSMPALAASLSHDSREGQTTLTLEDFYYAVTYPNSDKAKEVDIYMDGMQDFASGLYFYEKKAPFRERTYCLEFNRSLFPSSLKPHFFYNLLTLTIEKEPIWLTKEKQKTTLSGMLAYALTKYYSCSPYGGPSYHAPLTK